MGLELASPERTTEGTGVGRSTADVIGELVDRETAGDMALRAAALAEMVGEAATPDTVVVVVAPRVGLAWDEPDVRLVAGLARVLPARGARLVLLVGPEPHSAPDAPAEGLHALVPGVVSPDVAAAIDAREGRSDVRYLALENGFLLVAPGCRPAPADVPKGRFADLSVVAKTCDTPWLSAYAQCHGHELLADAGWLRDQAARRSAEGSTDLALRLAERAAGCGRGLADRLAGESVLQGMRIATQRFAQAAAQQDPPATAPAAQRAFLLEAKGWGLTMTGQPQEAERYLSEARALTEPGLGDERDRLYLLNISALNRLRLGDSEGALDMEREIEERHALLPRRDWRLEYLNALNTARLLRKLGRLEEALAYFERAFATTLGVRSSSDAVYTNFTLARLALERGQAASAFAGFLRAAAHWLALRVPESLAPRAVRSVTGQAAEPGADRVEDVSAALLAALLDHAPQSAHDDLERAARSLGGQAPDFVSARDLPPDAVVGGGVVRPGLGILATRAGVVRRSPATDSPSRVALRATVSATVMDGGPIPAGATVVIDDRLGTEVPTTYLELVESALRLEGRWLSVAGGRRELDAAQRSRLEDNLEVSLGPAVDRVEPLDGRAEIVFRRRLAPATLSAPDAELVSLVGDEPTVARLREDAAAPDVLAMLRGLETRRIVTLRATAEGWAAAGPF
ncbi:MAG: hypothetical protein QOJ97_178 [Solirubrobacteraceae bacterium]|nr:hypothetical protein [Solirubrobacteraceae bacterium]